MRSIAAWLFVGLIHIGLYLVHPALVLVGFGLVGLLLIANLK